MSTAGLKANRPLSPHLQIHTFYMTMAMSIVHRITGVGLYFGTLLLAWWLVAAASGPAYFDFVNRILGSWIGIIVLFLYSWTLIHHMLGGLRHFVWDTGHGLGKPERDILATATLIGSITLTVLLWIVGLLVR
jgi:succinate dehydrogenase / fumarate reductase, cytochrome b subunit